MSLYDFFFPEQAEASHLRKLVAEQQRTRHANMQSNREASENSLRIYELEERVLDLERDLGFVSLLLGGILDTVETKGVASRSDVQQAMQDLDAIDGFKDNRLDINVLRGKTSD